uniref:Chemokine interleukin-8-like domain-containing protein n=1 Tax=Maylandia zebra TaxID=106582 RepID=A0A3P9CEJ1_9CICH
MTLSNPCFSVTAKAVNSPEVCCFEFFDKRIPKANIVSIVKTHNQCATPAFIQMKIVHKLEMFSYFWIQLYI